MKEGPDIVRIAALIGDPARANMLTALMAGKALTAGELAQEAGVTLQTASGHLAKLQDGGLIGAQKQGRHKYFALAGTGIARVLEELMGLAAASGHVRTRTGPRNEDLRAARVCYNHLAGAAGVRLYDSLRTRGMIVMADAGLTLSPAGEDFARTLGVVPEALRTGRGAVCRDCLDWSERRAHLAGTLGRALFSRMQALGWCRRAAEGRAVHFTAAGRTAFETAFPLASGGGAAT